MVEVTEDTGYIEFLDGSIEPIHLTWHYGTFDYDEINKSEAHGGVLETSIMGMGDGHLNCTTTSSGSWRHAIAFETCYGPIHLKKMVLPTGCRKLKMDNIASEATITIDEPVVLPKGVTQCFIPSTVIIDNLEDFTHDDDVYIRIESIDSIELAGYEVSVINP